MITLLTAKNFLGLLLSLHILHCAHGVFPPCEDGPCSVKQFYDEATSSCKDCPKNHFMNLTNHKCRMCFLCKTADEFRHEIVLQMCTPEADAVIGCKNGYYREKRNLDGDCKICNICNDNEEMVKHCGLFSDTECRPVTNTFQEADGEHRDTNRPGKTLEPNMETAAEEKPNFETTTVKPNMEKATEEKQNMTENVDELESQSNETKDGAHKKPKCLTFAGLTDYEDKRPITEVLGFIFSILLSFALTFLVMLPDFLKWMKKRRARRENDNGK